jgi:hypothetical protein
MGRLQFHYLSLAKALRPRSPAVVMLSFGDPQPFAKKIQAAVNHRAESPNQPGLALQPTVYE